MPTINIPQRNVEPTGLPNVRSPNLPKMPGLERSGQAAINLVSDLYEKEKNKLDKSVTLEADTELQQLATNIDLHIAQNYRGKNAAGAPEYAKAEFEKGASEIINNLSNDEQKFSVQQRAISHYGDLDRRTKTNAFNETEKFSKDTKDHWLINQKMTLEKNYKDPELLQRSLGEGISIINDFNRPRGVPDEVTEAEILKYKDDLYKSADKGLNDHFNFMMSNFETNRGNVADFVSEINLTKDGQYVYYPWVDAKTRRTMLKDVKERNDQSLTSEKEMIKKQQEAIEKGFVAQEINRTLTETEIVKSGIDPDKQRIWIDRLQAQRDRDKRLAKEKKEAFKSDPVVNASLYSKIVKNPNDPEVSDQKLLDHGGVDLTQEDVEHLIDEKDKRLKPDKPERNPIADAQDAAIMVNFGRDYTEGRFGEGTEGQNEQAKQITAYRQWRALNPDEDGTEYYTKIMTPIAENQVQRMLDWIPGYQTKTEPDPKAAREKIQKEDPMRQQAIDILTKNKKQATEANISFVMDKLRKQK